VSSKGSPEPAEFLVRHLDHLPPGRVLDLAMGEGRNAIYLATQGFTVEGLDQDAQAVRRACEAAQEKGLWLEASTADLEQITLPVARYDVILCFYYLQRSLIPQIKAALRPGGVVVQETYLIDNYLQFNHPRHREYCFEHNELPACYQEFRILAYHEGLLDGVYRAQLLAQKTVTNH